MSQPKVRINKLLAMHGISSRRKADQLVSQGRVSINGRTVKELGTQVDPITAKIEVDGAPLHRKAPKLAYYLLHKPKKVVTTLSDPEGRETIKKYIPTPERLFPVGRLDYDAEGLILLTNDGDLAHRLMHPKFEIPRTYLVKVDGKPDMETIQKLRRGIKLEDGFIRPLLLEYERTTGKHNWYRISVAEGRTHLIKRIWMRAGHSVIKLLRVEFGGLKLGDLPVGAVRPLGRLEIQRLKQLVAPKEGSGN
jgi:23S rRNA pseudouridine2605 synthase